jgi:hypothetical protein
MRTETDPVSETLGPLEDGQVQKPGRPEYYTLSPESYKSTSALSVIILSLFPPLHWKMYVFFSLVTILACTYTQLVETVL